MADKRTQRKEKARAKQRAKDKGRRRAARSTKGLSVEKASRWPLREAWLSEGWDTPGPSQAMLVRQRSDGTAALAAFSVDTEGRGVLEAALHLGIDDDVIRMQTMSRSEGRALVTVEPELVAQLVDKAAEMGKRNGHSPPNALAKARRLFGDIDPGRASQSVSLGDDLEDADTEEVARPADGWFTKVKSALGFGA